MFVYLKIVCCLSGLMFLSLLDGADDKTGTKRPDTPRPNLVTRFTFGLAVSDYLDLLRSSLATDDNPVAVQGTDKPEIDKKDDA
jgi:hypothetical protein